MCLREERGDLTSDPRACVVAHLAIAFCFLQSLSHAQLSSPLSFCGAGSHARPVTSQVKRQKNL